MAEETSNKKILVVGGGISGISVAVEAAEVGYEVVLIEKQPFLGGRVARMYQYFPKLCPPACGLEINFRRIKLSDKIEVLTLAELSKVEGAPGNYKATVSLKPRYVNENCTACGLCSEAVSGEVDTDYNSGMGKEKVIGASSKMAYPPEYVLYKDAASADDISKAKAACKYDAIDENMVGEEKSFDVSAIVYATGWKPYAAENLTELGFGAIEDVITNVQMERLANQEGPTGGKIIRPSDGKEIEKIAFVQCAGSRDENFLPYCSGVCCMASLKHANYVREAYPDAEVYIFYIDIRTPGKLEDFYQKVQEDEKVHLIKGKVAKIEKDGSDVVVTAEDVEKNALQHLKVDMVVLATGIVPEAAGQKLPVEGVKFDEYGFITGEEAVIPVGCAKTPMDVASSIQDATAAALKAIQIAVRS
jgi:quinone-modifying oxidoreductase, subunit QmoA